ncbi:LOW QUALITY PROTEIN: agrin-like [Osmerus mordax]|uniref:LOW QUALITY PROTEIN: agrin-like n=1 Tax=Osmerus mordax TaxID=8014 RepID=UPI00351000D7
MLCGFGAVCERNPSDPAKAECVCKRMACPSVVAPVCGSDSSTYSNECELEKAQCSTQRRIKVLRKGPCALKDPCSEVSCSYRQHLRPVVRRPVGQVHVPPELRGRGPGGGVRQRRQDYRNQCELHKHACDAQQNVQLQHQGPLRVEPRTRRPLVFAPPESCPPGGDALCASDGQTYNSECHMTRVGMLQNLDIKKVHAGRCRTQGEAERTARRSASSTLCVWWSAWGPRCSCEPLLCDGSYKPLCGRDGHTYSNDCERRRAECQSKSHIPVKQLGPCVSDKKGAYLPLFSGDSYLELKGLHLYGHDPPQKVSMTVVLMANSSNGMIFYNGQKTDGKGDFISLSLNDGILEFRYDLGKGPAVLRSKEKLKMNVWNFVNLERANRKGQITVNGKDAVLGESPNQHTALNLKESLFVGGAPDLSRLARAASIKDGFKGSIQKITLMGTSILKQEHALHSSGVSMFEDHPCSQEPCHNGGRCNPLLEAYECVCLHGYTGTHCQNTIYEKSAGETEAIAFDGRTFIEYHNAVTKSEKALLVNKFELSIRTEATQGLVMWSGKGVEGSDYIALAVVDGRIQMTYDLGSKPVVLRSSVRVNTNRWIRIKASRALRDGSLQVGNEAAVTGSSPLMATQLDTDGALWLGGLEELAVARRLPKAYSTGFVGCVKDVLVDGLELHLVEDALNSPKILHCSSAK